MKRRTKVLLVIVAGLLIIVGIFGATAAFADSSTTGGATTANLTQQIADNYHTLTGQSLNTTALQQAFDQAQAQVQQDQVKSFLDKLVQNGTITQDQENQYLSWLSSRPNVPQLNGHSGMFGRMFGQQGFGRVFGGFGHRGRNQNRNQRSNSTSTLAPMAHPSFSSSSSRFFIPAGHLTGKTHPAGGVERPLPLSRS